MENTRTEIHDRIYDLEYEKKALAELVKELKEKEQLVTEITEDLKEQLLTQHKENPFLRNGVNVYKSSYKQFVVEFSNGHIVEISPLNEIAIK